MAGRRVDIPLWRIVSGLGAHRAVQVLGAAHEAYWPERARSKAVFALLATLVWSHVGMFWLFNFAFVVEPPTLPSEAEEIIADLASDDEAKRVRAARQFREARLAAEYPEVVQRELARALPMSRGHGGAVVIRQLVEAVTESDSDQILLLEEIYASLKPPERERVIRYYLRSQHDRSAQALAHALRADQDRQAALAAADALVDAPTDRLREDTR